MERAPPMPLPKAIVAALASRVAARQRRDGRNTVTAIGKMWSAALVSDQRGPMLTKKAKSKSEAYAQAHVLLYQAEEMAWFRGEVVGVRVGQADR
jgi:hypothetical protein